MRSSYLALLLLLPLPLCAQESMEIPPPDYGAHEILVRGDTVWFLPPSSFPYARDVRGLGYVKATASWTLRRIHVPDVPDRPEYGDTAVVDRLWPGVYLVHVRDTAVAGEHLYLSPVDAVRDSATGRLTPLLIPNTPANRRQEFGPGEDVSDSGYLSTFPASWTVEGEHAWFGLWAGPTYIREHVQGESTPPLWLGGLLRYDRVSGQLTPLLHPELRTRWVGALAFAGNALWLAAHEPEYDALGPVPLLRYTPADSTWQVFHAGSSPVPGRSVSYLQADGDLLLVSADSGVAVLDTRTGDWSVRWYDTLVRDDSVLTIYPATRPHPDPARDAVIDLAESIHEKHLSALLAAARKLPPERFADFIAARSVCQEDTPRLAEASCQSTHAAALAHPVFLPFLAKSFRENADYPVRLAAGEALLRIHDPAALAVLREAFASSRVEWGAQVAGPLVARGDARARAWLHARLAEAAALPHATTPWDTAARRAAERQYLLVFAAEEGHDSAAVPLLLQLAARHDATSAALAVLELGTRAQKRELVALLPAHRALWYTVLDTVVLKGYGSDELARLDHSEMRDPAFARGLTAVARTVLVLPDSALTPYTQWPASLSALQTDAISVLASWGVPLDVPLLMTLLWQPRFAQIEGVEGLGPFHVAEALVFLTGVDAAPRPTSNEVTALQRFWLDWWAAHRASFRVRPLPEREKAMQRWRARHHLPECCE